MNASLMRGNLNEVWELAMWVAEEEFPRHREEQM